MTELTFNIKGDAMRIYGMENNDTIMKELGQRLKDTRIAIPLTQQELADRAGISLRTVIRIEKGESVRIDYILSVLRAMDLLKNLEIVIPEQIISPVQLHDYGKKRKRATSSRKKQKVENEWKWGDEK